MWRLKGYSIITGRWRSSITAGDRRRLLDRSQWNNELCDGGIRQALLWLSDLCRVAWQSLIYCQLACLSIIHCSESKKLDPFSFEHNFGKYCPILITLSLLQTEIICPQTCNWISHFTYSLLLRYLEKRNWYTSSQKLLNKSAMHAVISLLLQSRKFW